ncbi:MAG: CHASE2 domain-containing protein [Cyanobacteria bacterium J06627_8]
MNKLVVLELEGDFNQTGFRVRLDIREESERTSLKIKGFLPPAPEMVHHLRSHWHDVYRSLGLTQRIKSQRIIHKGSLNQRIVMCRESAHELRDRFQLWLNSESFQPIDKRLREELSRTDTIRFLIRTENVNVQRMPWSEWDFFARYSNAELALSPSEYECRPPRSRAGVSTVSAVRILAILGHRQGIDLDADYQLLKQLPHADVEFLVEPTRQEVSDRLWEQSWDILFFAGHSETEGETGRIYINPTDSFSISELKYSLQKAIEHGLQLAIFNSCDGLGLARELQSLSIAQMIVMREPVTDQVAQTFLRYFLNAFANGESLYLATRHARERLQGIEDRFPCASWLPIIYQNPLAIPPDWSMLGANANHNDDQRVESMARSAVTLPSPVGLPRDRQLQDNRPILSSRSAEITLRTSSANPAIHDTHRTDLTDSTVEPSPLTNDSNIPHRTSETVSSPQKKRSLLALIPPASSVWLSVVIAVVIFAIRLGGVFQGVELATYDQMVRTRAVEPIDNRILVVEVTQSDVNSQGGYPLKDQVLTATIQALQQYNPSAIAIDMHRYQARGNKGRAEFINEFQRNENVFLVCAFNNPNQQEFGQDYAPPPEFSTEQRLSQVGFSNFPIDMRNRVSRSLATASATTGIIGNRAINATVRRQLLTYDPNLLANPSRCITPYSLSFQLAYSFLNQLNVPLLDVNDEGHWQFGKTVFKPLTQRFGAYQNLDGQSDQIMLNYRSASPGQRVSLSAILNGKVDASIVRDRLVLVGYTAPVARDTVQTPYGLMAGVWVHAHMTSQLLGSVLDERPLIWVLPQWGNLPILDGVWIIGWSLIAGLMAYHWQSHPWRLGGAIALLIIGIYQVSLIAMMCGGWLPMLPTILSVVIVGVAVMIYCRQFEGMQGV